MEEKMMIDYYMVDFWIGMSQIITILLLCFFFYSWLVFERYKPQFRLLTIIFGVLNTIIFVITAIWAFIL